MRHILYLLGLVFIFSSCENVHPELADADPDQAISGQNFEDIAIRNIQSITSQQNYLKEQNEALSLSENERGKALSTASNASETVDDLYKSYNNIGNEHYRSGNYNLALLFYLTSVELKLQGSDDESLALTYRNIALTYEALGNYENAAINFWQSYYLYQSLEDDEKVATLLNDLGAVYDLAHDFIPRGLFQPESSLALDFYNQSVELNESLGDIEGVNQTEINIGLLFQTYSKGKKSSSSRTDLEPSRDQDDVEDEL